MWRRCAEWRWSAPIGYDRVHNGGGERAARANAVGAVAIVNTMDYEQFFGLHDAPFSLAPDVRYLFESVSHTSALQQLAYAIERHEPLIVMTGEIGTGKTFLCRAVLQRLDRKTFVTVINDPLLDCDDLLRQMLQDFGVISADRTRSPVASRHDLVHALEDFLSSLIALDAHAVVIVDEAQHVRPEVLEQIRLLSSIDAPKGTMLQIILSGQLDLEALLARPELRQVQQRVSRRIRLEPLGEGELHSYINHRLAVGSTARSRMPGSGDLARALEEWNGGDTGVTFTADAVQAVWRWSAGLPRVINILCDRTLEEAYAGRMRTVDAGLVERAAALLQLGANPSPAAPAPPAQADRDLPNAPDVFERSAAARSQRRTHLAAWAAAFAVVGAVAGWSVFGGLGRSADGVGVRPAPPADPPRAGSPATAQTTAAPTAAPAPVSIEAPVVPLPATAPVTAFEIIVASFRTEARAASVMSQVTAAGLPVRQRLLGGWQQVLAGPFPSREEADAGRLRLERAGLPGTQVVETQR